MTETGLFTDKTKINMLKEDLDQAQEIIIEQQSKIDKAIEILKIGIDRCNGALSNPEETIVCKHSLLKLERQCYKELLEILGGEENE